MSAAGLAMSTDVLPAFSRIDPDSLCLGCLRTADPSGACPSCGFDERAAIVSPLHLPPRTILHGQYLLGRVLGQGGFGITYLGWDLNLEVAVAIKEFLPTDFASRASGHIAVTPYGDDGRVNFESGLEAFEGEARTLARCFDLDGVVDVLNYFRENGTGYIVMPYIAGRTLRDHLKQRETPMPFDDAVAIMRPVLIALQEVHRLGLVHRDVSPDNIYVAEAGRVCLLDFGAARHAVRERSKSLSVQFKVGYTPEEQYQRHGKQGPWTDVYATAATIYRAITGLVPPPALDRRVQDSLRPPGTLGVTLPRASERALMKGLAISANERYQTMAEFLHDLAPDAGGAQHSAGKYGAGQRGGANGGGSGSGGAMNGGANRASSSMGFGDAINAFGQSVIAAGTWIGTAIADVARLVRARLDAALQRGESGSRERQIREQLATLWPVTLVSASLRDPHLPAGPDHGPFDVYARDETREVSFEIALQSNFAGIRSLAGTLGARYIDPFDASIGLPAPDSARPCSVELDVRDFADRVVLSGHWGPDDPQGFQPGVWRIEFWWDGRKIGERGFVISA
jgi:Protein kinase domain